MLHHEKHTDIADDFQLHIARSTALIIGLLCILNLVVYSPSIGGFFLSDDFLHIDYLYDVFHGQPILLLANFFTNWMQAASAQFYRPLISLSLALDYLVWGNNAIGFHLSNLFYQTCSTILLYLLIQRLAIILGSRRSKLVAAVTAAFFAVYPLHPEVVSWVIGRVDSVATVFYLAAFLMFLKYEEERSETSSLANLYVLSFSLICYVLAMLSKEIAVTLPISLWLWHVMFNGREKKAWNKIIFATKITLPYWLLLGVFIAVRSMVLGTIWGGYTGSVASTFNVFKQFLEQHPLLKLVFPFNDEMFSPRNLLRRTLRILYTLAIATFTWRLFSRQFYCIPGKLIIYAILWFIACLIPACPVLYLSANLQGSRFFYLASMPICFLFSLVLVPLLVNGNDHSAGNEQCQNTYTKFLTPISASLCLAILLSFSGITYINNLPWRHASDELRELQMSLLNKAATLKQHQKLVLVNMPYTYKGAHLLYNGSTLNLMCSPKATGKNISCPVITFEHPLFGDPDLLNMTRLQRLLTKKDDYVFVAWQRNLPNKLSNEMFATNPCGYLRDIALSSTIKTDNGSLDLGKPQIKAIDPSKYEFVELTPPSISTANYGLLEVTVKTSDIKPDATEAAGLTVQWFTSADDAISKEGSLAQPLVIDGSTHKYLFNLRDHKSWLLCNNVTRLKFSSTPGKYKLEIQDVRFVSPASMIPYFDLYGNTAIYEDTSGIYHLTHKQVITFQYDVSHIIGAHAVVCEISKSNVFFEHEDHTLNSDHFSKNAILHRTFPVPRGDFEILGTPLESDYFETHLAAVDKEGHMIGLMSDPIYGQVGL